MIRFNNSTNKSRYKSILSETTNRLDKKKKQVLFCDYDKVIILLRNDFLLKADNMRFRNLFLYMTCIITISIYSGCTHTKPNTEKIVKKNVKPPFITSVQSCRIIENSYVASTSLNLGEKGTFRITVNDQNPDIKKLFIRGYFPRESEIHTIEYGPLEVDAHDKKRTSFYLKDPITFEGDPGDWLFEVQAEDKYNNLSNKYRFHVILH